MSMPIKFVRFFTRHFRMLAGSEIGARDSTLVLKSHNIGIRFSDPELAGSGRFDLISVRILKRGGSRSGPGLNI